MKLPSKRSLCDVRVLDLSQNIAGAYCSKLMVRSGAEVIKVEPPETGDPLRSCGPFYQNQPGLERSIPFLWFHTGKKSITLDVFSKKQRDDLLNLIRSVDVVVESYEPGVLQEHGLDFAEMSKVNPSVILLSITNFGQTGPYKNYHAEDITVYALSGQMFATGDPSQPPLNSGAFINQTTAGMHAYLAALLLLFRRSSDTQPRHVDVAILDAGRENLEMKAMSSWRANANPSRQRLSTAGMNPWGWYRASNGYIAILKGPFRYWSRLFSLLPTSWLLDAFFKVVLRARDSPQTLTRRIVFRLFRFFNRYVHWRVKGWAACRTTEEIMKAGTEQGLAFAPVHSLENAMASPQHESRGFFVEIEHPVVGLHAYCRCPWPLNSVAAETRSPLLGEHHAEVLEAARNGGADRPSRQHAAPSSLGLPLDGLRIIDLTHIESGPHATRLLADYGAEVIRIENASRFCIFRGLSTQNKAYDKQALWPQLNRNKRSLTLDLKSERERLMFTELLQMSDVVITNFREESLGQLGIDYDTLRKIKPDLIMVSMSAYGHTGPYASYPGFGGTIEAMSGLGSITKYHRDGKPQRIREMDVFNGVAGACAVMEAVVHRATMPEGQYIDMSQMEATTHGLLGVHLLEHAMNGEQTMAQGNRHSQYAPQGCYPCKGRDQWIVISIRDEQEWRALCESAGHLEGLKDPRFSTMEARRKHHDELDAVIAAWTKGWSHIELMNLLQRASIPAGAVLNFQEAVHDPHFRARNEFTNESYAGCEFMGLPFKVSGITANTPRPGPALGQDNEYVICELLGRTKEDLMVVDKKDLGTVYQP